MLGRESKWTFETSGTMGVNVDVFAVNGGEVILDDPEGASHRYYYGGVGAGLGVGFKLPKIGKIEVGKRTLGTAITGTIAPEKFINSGKVYMTDWFKGEELERKDFTGICMFLDGGGGLIGGGSGTVMCLGVHVSVSGLWKKSPIGSVFLQQIEPKAFLCIAGLNVGVQGGAGIAGFLGYMGSGGA